MRGAALVFLAVAAAVSWPAQAQNRATAPQVRLYVFDCGRLKVEDPSRFNFKKEELRTLNMAVPCFLVTHDRETLMWDTGVVPDSAFPASGGPATKLYATATVPLARQLSQAGFQPQAITYLALSHYHWDHVGNAGLFANATWLVTKVEHDALFSDNPPARTDRASYEALRNSKTVFLPARDYDVFGDGSVVMKPTPGHTPGHHVLFLKLAKTGPVVLSGDLYHYPEERATGRVPNGEFDARQTLASRAAIEAFLKTSGAQLWIQHDLAAFNKLRKAPAYYE